MKLRNILWPLSMLLAFVAGTLTPLAVAQSPAATAQPPQTKYARFVEVDYMKAQPGKEADYVRMERETWKPLHEERIKRGQLRSWAFYGLRFPSGDDEKYDFVTINAFDRFAQLENPYADLDRMLSTGQPNRKMADLEQETSANRRLVRSEVWQLIDETR